MCPDLINRCRFHGQLILKFLLSSLFKIKQMYLKVTKWFDKKALHSQYVIYYWRGTIHTDHRHQNQGGWKGETGQALLSPHQIRILRIGENDLSFLLFSFFWGGLGKISDKCAPTPSTPPPHFQFASDTYNCSYADNILSILSGIIWKSRK